MAHDIFISHSAKDKAIADGVCAALEAAGIRCWIAPRDVPDNLAKMDWPQAIVNAISDSRVMVLIFSANANTSKPVANELSLAMNENVIVIPFKIEDILPEGPLKFYLANTHWLDAVNPPTEKQIKALVETVSMLMTQSDKQVLPKNSEVSKKRARRWLLWAAGILALTASLLGTFFTIDPFDFLSTETIEQEPPPAIQETAISNYGVPEIIFAEDFQSGTFTNLQGPGPETDPWTLVSEGDDYSLEVNLVDNPIDYTSYSFMPYFSEEHEEEWADVTVTFRFKLMARAGNLTFRFRRHRDRIYRQKHYFYQIRIQSDSLYLEKVTHDPGIESDDPTLVSVFRNIGVNQWHTLKVSTRGNNIRVYLNDNRIIDYWDDNEPFLLGTLSWAAHSNYTNDHYLIDDIVAFKNTLPGMEVTLPPQEQVYIPSIMATVKGLRFFQLSGYGNGLVPVEHRRYTESFYAGTTRYIWWELYLTRETGPRTEFRIYAEYYCPEGELIHTHTVDDLWIDQGWTESLHTAGIGYRLPGNWKPGIYEVKLFHTDTVMASGEFEIVSGE